MRYRLRCFLTLCALFLVLVGMGGLVTASAAATQAAELLLFLPDEPGFTWRYEDLHGQRQWVTLEKVERQPLKQETVFFLHSQPEAGAAGAFSFQYVFRDGMVQVRLPREPQYWERLEPGLLLFSPLTPGQRRIHLLTLERTMVSTVLCRYRDPLDKRQTVVVQYELTARNGGEVFYTEERMFKEGLGLVRLERRNSAGEVIAVQKLISAGAGRPACAP